MIKVKWLKAHYAFGYFAGDVGFVTPEWAEKLLAGGYIILVPEAIKTDTPSVKLVLQAKPVEPPNPVNTLPEDMPGRDKLFATGFTSVDKVKEVAVVDDGDGLLDVGISVSIVRKIRKYLKLK